MRFQLKIPIFKTRLFTFGHPKEQQHSKGPKSSHKVDFLRDEDGYVVVYTDGACFNNGKRNSRAGIGVWFNFDHHLNVAEPLYVQRPTSNLAEIFAAKAAVDQGIRAGLTHMCINTDSKYLINCLTLWISKWKKNNWVRSTGEMVRNRHALTDLEKAITQMENVEWLYVPAHSGNIGNEMANHLARIGAEDSRQ